MTLEKKQDQGSISPNGGGGTCSNVPLSFFVVCGIPDYASFSVRRQNRSVPPSSPSSFYFPIQFSPGCNPLLLASMEIHFRGK